MMSAGEAFGPLRSALESAGVRDAVGGSWASTAFGEPRFTNDVDILADFSRDLIELDRAVCVAGSGLSDVPVPFVTPEDILLAKLNWFRAGGDLTQAGPRRRVTLRQPSTSSAPPASSARW